MKLNKKIPLSFEKNDYEIRVFYDDTTIKVITFKDNYPANGFRYEIKLPKSCEIRKVLEQNIPEKLIEIAKSDIIEKRWEKIRNFAIL